MEQDQKCRNIHRNGTCVAIAIFKRQINVGLFLVPFTEKTTMCIKEWNVQKKKKKKKTKKQKNYQVLEESTGEFIYNLEIEKAFLSAMAVKKRLKILTITESRMSLQQKST